MIFSSWPFNILMLDPRNEANGQSFAFRTFQWVWAVEKLEKSLTSMTSSFRRERKAKEDMRAQRDAAERISRSSLKVLAECFSLVAAREMIYKHARPGVTNQGVGMTVGVAKCLKRCLALSSDDDLVPLEEAFLDANPTYQPGGPVGVRRHPPKRRRMMVNTMADHTVAVQPNTIANIHHSTLNHQGHVEFAVTQDRPTATPEDLRMMASMGLLVAQYGRETPANGTK